jgi:ABC-type dipeptide/oligopeptide/nickel transport system permease component
MLRRLLVGLLTIWLAASLAFFALRVLPGDAVSGQLIHTGASSSVIAERRAQQRLDEPLWAQYMRFMAGLVQGDLGYSLLDGQPVVEKIIVRLPATAALASSAFVVACILGILLGMIGAFDGTAMALSRVVINLMLSAPIYWTGTLVIIVSTLFHLNYTASTLIPALVLGFHSAGAIARTTMMYVYEARAADFVRTARAKGLRERRVITAHVLRIGLIPVITVIALQAGFLFGGTVVTESLFTRPGLGRLLLDAALTQDYPVVQGVVVFAAAVYTGLTILADIIQHLSDPRIRFR